MNQRNILAIRDFNELIPQTNEKETIIEEEFKFEIIEQTFCLLLLKQCTVFFFYKNELLDEQTFQVGNFLKDKKYFIKEYFYSKFYIGFYKEKIQKKIVFNNKNDSTITNNLDTLLLSNEYSFSCKNNYENSLYETIEKYINFNAIKYNFSDYDYISIDNNEIFKELKKIGLICYIVDRSCNFNEFPIYELIMLNKTPYSLSKNDSVIDSKLNLCRYFFCNSNFNVGFENAVQNILCLSKYSIIPFSFFTKTNINAKKEIETKKNKNIYNVFHAYKEIKIKDKDYYYTFIKNDISDFQDESTAFHNLINTIKKPTIQKIMDIDLDFIISNDIKWHDFFQLDKKISNREFYIYLLIILGILHNDLLLIEEIINITIEEKKVIHPLDDYFIRWLDDDTFDLLEKRKAFPNPFLSLVVFYASCLSYIEITEIKTMCYFNYEKEIVDYFFCIIEDKNVEKIFKNKYIVKRGL